MKHAKFFLMILFSRFIYRRICLSDSRPTVEMTWGETAAKPVNV
jgi:hypothetical protein